MLAAAEPGGLYRGARGPARLTVLSGPSAVGKSTVVARLRAEWPMIWQSVSVTTRPPRPGEIDGREYQFVTEAEFDALAERGDLLESARYVGYRYGTPRAPVQEQLGQGNPALLEIDVAGARQVRAAVPDALLVFLAPPSWAELERRLVGRKTESADKVARRLQAARAELEAEGEFDITLVNTSVEDVCEQLVALILGQDAYSASGGARQGNSCNSELEGTRWQRLRP
ncbi:MAG: guanylate kinase [Actinobacteria bacterium]|nr:guanylate kinase [Actinomycetota bacterium]